MKIYKGTVDSVTDMEQAGGMKVNLPNTVGPQPVSYMSPMSNSDGGIFAPPTPNSTVLVLELDADETPGKSGGLYYLGSIVGGVNIADPIDSLILSQHRVEDPLSADEVKMPGGKIKAKSIGAESDNLQSKPMDVEDAYANGVTPEKMCFLDKGRNGLILKDMHHGGDQPWMTMGTRLQSGQGKRLDFLDAPAQDQIKMTTGKDSQGLEDSITLAGRQESMGIEGSDLQAGEFRVDSRGPTNILSRQRGVEVRVGVDGRNIEIINQANGFISKDPTLGRRLSTVGGGNPSYILAGEYPVGPTYIPYPRLPYVSKFFGLHPDVFPPGTGGNPLDQGSKDWGCINIRTEWNNINLVAEAHDSVIHINAPYHGSKIVVTTGGTVDIIAENKISLTSNTKIELNAPQVDINTPDVPTEFNEEVIAENAIAGAPTLASLPLGRVDLD